MGEALGGGEGGGGLDGWRVLLRACWLLWAGGLGGGPASLRAWAGAYWARIVQLLAGAGSSGRAGKLAGAGRALLPLVVEWLPATEGPGLPWLVGPRMPPDSIFLLLRDASFFRLGHLPAGHGGGRRAGPSLEALA